MSNRWFAATFVNPFVLTGALVPLPQKTESEWKAYDVSPILRSNLDGSNSVLWGSHIRKQGRSEGQVEESPTNPYFVPRETGPVLRPDDLLGLIRSSVTPSVWSQGEGTLDIQETSLLVDAPPTTQREV